MKKAQATRSRTQDIANRAASWLTYIALAVGFGTLFVWWLVLGAIGFMMLVGLVVVFIPARQAARLNPIDALRRE